MKLILGRKPEEKSENIELSTVKKTESITTAVKTSENIKQITAEQPVSIEKISNNAQISENKQYESINNQIISERHIEDSAPYNVNYFNSKQQFLYEDTEKRVQNGKHYVSNDGTVTAVFENRAVHYFDTSDNKFKDIDNGLQDKGNVFEAKANGFSVQFKKDFSDGKVFELIKNDCKISFISRDAAAKNNLSFENGKNGIFLKEIKSNTDVSYTVESDRIRENIIINEKADSYEYSFNINIENMTAEMSEGGKSLQLKSKKTGEVVFFMPVPLMLDAKGGISEHVWYEIEALKENTLNLKLFADAGWLNANDRVLPAVITPQIISVEKPVFAMDNYSRPSYDAEWIKGDISNLPAKNAVSAETKSVLTIDKNILNLGSQKISKVTLKLQPASGNSYIYDAGSIKNFSAGTYTDIDITKSFIYANDKVEIVFGGIGALVNPNSYLGAGLTLNPNDPLINPADFGFGTIPNPNNPLGGIGTTIPSLEELLAAHPVQEPLLPPDIHFPPLVVYPPINDHPSFVFDPDEGSSMVLEVEYLTSDDSVPTKEKFSLAGNVSGTLNLTTGDFVTGFTDASTKNSALACLISHVYKKNSTHYDCGKNWRLNLHQTLVKNTAANVGVDYIYTDSDGEKHGFIETYYYLNASNNKVAVPKNDVTVELDGSLWYKSGSSSYEVFKDQRTATGMTLTTKMEGFKNAENLEQRQKELKETEDYLLSCKNNLKENVVVDILDGKIKKELKNSFSGDILLAASFNTYITTYASVSGRMVLSKGEALQYSSLFLQEKQILEQIDSLEKQEKSLGINLTSIVNSKTSIDNNIKSLVHNISSIDTQIEGLVCQINSLTTQKKVVTGETEDLKTEQKNNLDSQILLTGTKSNTLNASVRVNGNTEFVSTQIACLKAQKDDLTKQKDDLNNQYKNLEAQRKDLVAQIEDITKISIPSAEVQKDAINEQKNYIKNKAATNLKELKRIFKEYTNKEFEFKKLKEQTPVSNLSDGSSSLCFNEAGKLCAITDKYNNSILIDYDHKGRVSKVNDGKRAIVLKYNYYGQLASVTDYRGRSTKYTYSSSSASANLTKVTYSDGNTLTFTYTGETIASITSSADRTKTLLSYSSDKLSKITNQSAASAIAEDKILDISAPVTMSVTEIGYYSNECTITTDGKLSWYMMDRLGNLVGGYAKLTDETFKERLHFNYFDRVNNWNYAVKENDDEILLKEFKISRDTIYIKQTFVQQEATSEFVASGLSFTQADPNKPPQLIRSIDTSNLRDRYDIIQTQIGSGSILGSGSLVGSGSIATSGSITAVGSGGIAGAVNSRPKFYQLTASSVISAASLPAGKTEFMFSAYATAPAEAKADTRFITAFHTLSPDVSLDKRFEITAEVNYKDKDTQIFVASFDSQNKNKQLCALPVTLDKLSLSSLESIVLKCVYSSNESVESVNFMGFRFAPCEWEYKRLDQFKNVSYSETSTVLRNNTQSSNAYYKAVVNYSYDNEHRLTQKRLTNTTSIASANTVNYAVSKYYYNDYGSVARTENYVEGEEGTVGIVVEETVYDEKGNVIKSLSYNTLDGTAKTYSEKEYSENGLVKAEIDITGENKTTLEYEPDTDAVQTKIKPDGGKFSYSRDYLTGNVTGITQSTESGEANSVETKYTCGVVTRLKSGLNTVNYEYDAKRRKTKVSLNGVEHVKYAYAEDTPSDKININDIEFGGVVSDKTTALLKGGTSPDIVTEAITDKRGNLISTVIDGVVQFANCYDNSGILLKSADNITGSTYTTDYDIINKRSTISSRAAGTKAGYKDLAAVSESYAYTSRGELSECAISVDGTVVQTYSHVYKNNAGRTLDSMALPNKLVFKPQMDVNGRKTGKILTDSSGNNKFGEYINYRKVGDHTTGMVTSIRYGEVKNGQYVIGGGLNYKYDVCGNISEIWENGELIVTYTYDRLQRLVREDNKLKGKSWFFFYDNNGNILSKKEANYTRKSVDEITEYSYEKHYSYDGDKLIDCSGEKFVYDGFGNPATYRNKKLKWKECKLVKFDDITFAYDGYGQRVKKGDIAYTYNLSKKILRQSNGTDTLEFIYDDNGLSGVKHGDTQYIYRKNLQGDITHIFNINGELAACYSYDAWGNHTVTDSEGKQITSENHIGNLNPFRYRGYLYDAEINLYFLENRYYDPETGRFISQDKVSYLDPNTVNGLNLFAYCGNNPVMRIDDTGCSWSSFWKKVWKGIKAVGKAIVGLAKTIGMTIAGVVMAAVGAVVALAGVALSIVAGIVGSKKLASFSGKMFQVGVSLTMYGGFMTAAAYSSAIYNDMQAIGWNPFNSDEAAVLNSKYVSFYKGMPVVRTNADRSGSFGVIALKRTEDILGDGKVIMKTGTVTDDGYLVGSHTLRHEYGHGVQQWNMGPIAYTFDVAIPSALKWGPWAAEGRYYDAPWEMEADILGGVPADSTIGGRSGNRNPSNAAIFKYDIFGWMSFFFEV